MAVPGQLGTQRQHRCRGEQGESEAPEPPAAAALLQRRDHRQRPEGQPGPAALQYLQHRHQPAAAVPFDRAHHPCQPLTPPHGEGFRPALQEVPSMPEQPRQQTDRDPKDQREPLPWCPAPLPGQQQASSHQQRQARRRLQQQDRGASGASDQAPAALLRSGRSWRQAQQGPPLQRHRADQAAIQHGQPAMTHQRQQGERHRGRAEGSQAIARAKAPLHQGHQGHDQAGAQRRNGADQPLRRDLPDPFAANGVAPDADG